jgi:hypothetical protein
MHASVLPGVTDLAGMVTYVLGNPYLFISSSTVMTTAVVAAIGALALAALRWSAPRRLIVRSAPTLTWVFAYFGGGSFALSVEILARFHDDIPLETETQFVSGVGHLVVAIAGIAIVAPFARHRPADWLLANAIALLYWTVQVVALDPPWFHFQGQGALIRTAALGAIAGVTLLTTIAGVFRRARHPLPAAARIPST